MKNEKSSMISTLEITMLSILNNYKFSLLPSLYIFCVYDQLCLTLCNPMHQSPPGFSVQEIFQARILEWVAISFFRESSLPRDQTHVSCIERRVLYQRNHRGSSLYAIIFFFLPICPRTGIFYLSAGLFHQPVCLSLPLACMLHKDQ